MSVNGDANVDRPIDRECGGTRRPGRPRDPLADEAIITAVVEVLTEQGFGGFTVEAVAARAGVGKATIYRRWDTKEDLVLAAAQRMMVHMEPPDTGSMRDDLVAWYWEKFRSKTATTSDRLFGQVIIEATVNPDLKKLLGRFIDGRRKAIGGVIDQARERDRCGDVDVPLLMDLISGALMHRSLFGDKQLRRSDVEAVVDAALRGVGAVQVTAQD